MNQFEVKLHNLIRLINKVLFFDISKSVRSIMKMSTQIDEIKNWYKMHKKLSYGLNP